MHSLGYPDLCIKALTDLADCEAHTGRVREAKSDYAFALRLAREKERHCPIIHSTESPMQTHRFLGKGSNLR